MVIEREYMVIELLLALCMHAHSGAAHMCEHFALRGAILYTHSRVCAMDAGRARRLESHQQVPLRIQQALDDHLGGQFKVLRVAHRHPALQHTPETCFVPLNLHGSLQGSLET